MKSSFIASTTVSHALRDSVQRAQLSLERVQKEAATGRHADAGLALGRDMAVLLTLKTHVSRFDASIDMNNLTASRLRLSQDTLSSLGAAANSLVSELVNARISPEARAFSQRAAPAALASFIEQANTAHNGQYLFGGIETAKAPLKAYAAMPASAAKTAVDAAFRAAFGMSQTDPAVAGITAAEMEHFLDGDFAALFEEGNWNCLWSDASSVNMASRITPGLVTETSVNANETAFRKLAMSLVMTGELGGGGLSRSAFDALAGRAVTLAAEATAGFGGVQSSLGAAQSQVSAATSRIERQRNLLLAEVHERESVDQYAAATQVNQLITQLEASYKLTARIGSLSLMTYL